MELSEPGIPQNTDAQSALQQALGYLNFSSGSSDPKFLRSLDTLFAESPRNTWQDVSRWLSNQLQALTKDTDAFSDASQANYVLSAMNALIPAYLEFHQDLLAHCNKDRVFNSFLCGRAIETILTVSDQTRDLETTIPQAIRRLNDYIGFRPVAILESQKIEPYEHEWLRPVPLYIQGAGSACGRYQPVVDVCLELLSSTDDALLRAAYFDPEQLEELALDPKAYDFDHPASKRPNHHFGMWDMHRIDNKGFYRRFVVQSVTMDALLRRVVETPDLEAEELLLEGAAVLAGTILMASGICGYGPDTHDSSVSLGPLLAKIATYRDAFYEQLIARIEGQHGARLREEAKRLQQPFAAARQDLNRQLTECRATQLQRVQLAKVYARMGYAEAATEQTSHVQVPAARMTCEIDCLLTKASAMMREGDLSASLQSIEHAKQHLHRGIACGAIVDPWNILGFDGNFSLFGALENSMRDYRVDDLVELIQEMMESYAQLWSLAAAREQDEICRAASLGFEEFVNWWHQFAAHELDTVDAENPHDILDAARNVAEALGAWHVQGEATGDIGFWSPHVQGFNSCRAYWLVINTLLERDDKVAALGLLMHWLGQADRIPLEQGETSFYKLSLHWLAVALRETGSVTEERTGWLRIRRFFDYLEANAGEYWSVPDFLPDGENVESPEEIEVDDDLDDDEPNQLFSAAYEDVVYRDSTDDGIEGSVFDFDTANEDYLQQVSRSIVDRLAFLESLSGYWKLIAVAWSAAKTREEPDASLPTTKSTMHDLFQSATRHMSQTVAQTNRLLDAVSRYRIALPSGDPDSVMNYDRLRLVKDSLADQIINTQVHLLESLQFLFAAHDGELEATDLSAEDQQVVGMLRAVICSDGESVKERWGEVVLSFENQPILYVPLARGGSAKTIVGVKARQKLAQNLLQWLPRVGLLNETFELIELLRQMERNVPVGAGAITEFDDLFEIGCHSIVACLFDAESSDSKTQDAWLVASLEKTMEPLLRSWLDHSRTLRLSVLEQVMDDDAWEDLVEFIRCFGRDLFTQRFLNLGNVRGILHQGVATWLDRLLEFSADEAYQPLLDALEMDLEMSEAVDQLTLILEAIVESYAEYRDYNSTTTQSDRGDMLYALLDFLRLRTSYDRIVWNLRPIVVAHQVLVSKRRPEVARQWRRSLRRRIQGEADRHMARLQDLQQQYAMRLPSIAERLNERFMRPLLVDQMCALIRPATEGATEEERAAAFAQIRQQADDFMAEPSGAGLDVPMWLELMEDEVRNPRQDPTTSVNALVDEFKLPSVKLSAEEIQTIVDQWRKEA